jgi:hypothetical protein
LKYSIAGEYTEAEIRGQEKYLPTGRYKIEKRLVSAPQQPGHMKMPVNRPFQKNPGITEIIPIWMAHPGQDVWLILLQALLPYPIAVLRGPGIRKA